MKNKFSRFFDLFLSAAAGAAIAFLIVRFVGMRVYVDGNSMFPTLKDKDIGVIEKISVSLHKFKRGEIVTLQSTVVEDETYIKRIIGLPGETIEIKYGKVYIDGKELEENYLEKGMATSLPYDNPFIKITLSENEVYVLGDNRAVSFDSRLFGPVKVNDLKGHFVLRVFPFNEFGRF